MKKSPVKIIELGLIDYERADRFQREILKNRQFGETIDTLLLMELLPVFTVGRQGILEHIINEARETSDTENIGIYEVDRGGDVTYHGPGQLVAYPICDLRTRDKDVKHFLQRLEDVVLSTRDEALQSLATGAADRVLADAEGHAIALRRASVLDELIQFVFP